MHPRSRQQWWIKRTRFNCFASRSSARDANLQQSAVSRVEAAVRGHEPRAAPLGERLWNQAGRAGWAGAAEHPGTACNTWRGACDRISSDFALVVPNKCGSFLSLWTKHEVGSDTEPARGHPPVLPPLQHSLRRGDRTFLGIMLGVGSHFWGDQNQKSLFLKASKYPLKPMNYVSTGWALHTYSHAVLGNKAVLNKGLQTHISWFQEEITVPLKIFFSAPCSVSLFHISGTAPLVKVSKGDSLTETPHGGAIRG